MKDEDIEKAAKEVVRELVRYCDQTPDHVEVALAILRPLVSKVRDEVLDKAERAVSGVSIYNSNHIVRQEVFPEEVRVRAINAVRALKSGSVEVG